MAVKKTKITTKEASENMKKTGKRKPPVIETTCSVCGEPFTIFAIHKNHKDPKCPACKKEKSAEKPNAAPPEFDPDKAWADSDPVVPVGSLDMPPEVFQYFRQKGIEPELRWLEPEQINRKGMRGFRPVDANAIKKVFPQFVNEVSTEVRDFAGGVGAGESLIRRGTMFAGWKPKHHAEAVRETRRKRSQEAKREARENLDRQLRRGEGAPFTRAIGDVEIGQPQPRRKF